MLREIDRVGFLAQYRAVEIIVARFGKEYAKTNRYGNLGVRIDVLRAFHHLTGQAVVWQQRTRRWRKRADGDDPLRRRQD